PRPDEVLVFVLNREIRERRVLMDRARHQRFGTKEASVGRLDRRDDLGIARREQRFHALDVKTHDVRPRVRARARTRVRPRGPEAATLMRAKKVAIGGSALAPAKALGTARHE